MPVTILVVGDHGVVRRALRGWLEITFPGCHVIEADENFVIVTDPDFEPYYD
jgi:hypothetical protein